MASSALRQALNKQDDVLGPWVPGRDPLEDALAAYAGMPPLFLAALRCESSNLFGEPQECACCAECES